jgi:hypothetical protein
VLENASMSMPVKKEMSTICQGLTVTGSINIKAT